jgi:hypothetical protein
MAHSRQKRWPWLGHETGSREGRRQSWQEPKGRKESRVRRVEREPQEDFSSLRSWAVKKVSFAWWVSMVLGDLGEGRRVDYCVPWLLGHLWWCKGYESTVEAQMM